MMPLINANARLTLLIISLLLSIPTSTLGQSSAGVSSKPDLVITSTASLAIAGNAFRDVVSFTNHSTTVAVRWGDSLVSATRGQRIPAGATAEIRNRGPIFMISEGASVTISVTEETR